MTDLSPGPKHAIGHFVRRHIDRACQLMAMRLASRTVSYKVLFHEGESISLATKGRAGRLSLEDGLLLIHGGLQIAILIEEVRTAEFCWLHNSLRLLKITHKGGVLFVSVVRFSLFGYFVLGNTFAGGRLMKELQAIATGGPRVVGREYAKEIPSP